MFKRELALRPNCLLTRRPIYLLTGPRSIFYYHSPWKQLHNYLYQHGYKASVFKMPFQDQIQRQAYLQKMLNRLHQSHVICDAKTYSDLKLQLNQIQDSTLTVLTDSPLTHLPEKTFQIIMNYKVFSPAYVLHQAYLKLRNMNTPSPSEVGLNIPPDIYHKILDHCVYLAEMDFYDLDLKT